MSRWLNRYLYSALLIINLLTCVCIKRIHIGCYRNRNTVPVIYTLSCDLDSLGLYIITLCRDTNISR
jgi:hypothetical protein